MFIIKRNQILIITLMIMVALAGYLNYADNKVKQGVMLDKDLGTTLIPSDIILENNENGNIKLDNKENVANEDDIHDDDEIGIATFVENDSDTFFLEAKINREQTREERKEWLMEVITTSATTDDAKENAMTEIINIQDRVEKEAQAESLIESKGFGNTYVRIDDDSVDVVVDKENLNQNEISQIADIIKRKTGFTIDKIKISPLKRNQE